MKQTNAKKRRGGLFAWACLFVLLLTGSGVWAQNRPVTGVVSDANGPMAGVTVVVKGATSGGAITDVAGKYTINVASGQTLQFVMYGYTTTEVEVGTQTTLNITLEEDITGLEEAVAIGYGTSRRGDLTGSITSLKPDVLLAMPSGDVMSALAGRVAGLDISMGENNKQELTLRGNRSLSGEKATIAGRSSGSMGGNNQPLIVIDGVLGGQYSDVNPSDIASMEVLKDASATAIYGARGANGVIIITTKSPEKGRMSVSYNAYAGYDMWADENPRRQGESWLNPRRIAAQNAGQWQSAADDAALFSTPEAQEAYNRGEWTDYRELTSRKPFFTNHSLSFSGGTENTNARFTVGWEEKQNRLKGGVTDKFTLRTIVNQKINDWLSGGVNVRLAHDAEKDSPYDNNGGGSGGWQLGSPYDANGNIVRYPVGDGGYINPLWNESSEFYNLKRGQVTRISATGFIDIKPMKGLTMTSQFNTNLGFDVEGSYVDKDSYNQIGGTKTTTASYTIKPSRYLEWNNIITYEKEVGDHRFGATVFSAWNKTIDETLSGTANGQLDKSNLWYALGGAPTQRAGSGYVQSQMFSYAGRVNYNYRNKYMFNASVRRDGASMLSEGHKWDIFPSVGLGWTVSNENFMQKHTWIDMLKLRLAYGVAGNSGIDPYSTQSGVSGYTTGMGFHDYGVVTYDYNGKIGNLETGWEKTTSLNLGVDFSIFKGRLGGTIEYYDTETNDLLIMRKLPTTAGADGNFTLSQNIGRTSNKGVEVTLNAFPIKKENFSWKTTLIFSRNKERILDLVDGKDIALSTDIEHETYMIGHPVNSYRTYEYQGIWSEAERAEAATYFKDVAKTSPFVPGDYKILDRNGDHVINIDGDYDYIGSQTPKWFASFDNNFRYKNWDLNIYFFFRWGQWGDNPASQVDPATGGGTTLYDKWFYHKDTNNGSGAKLPPLDAGKKAFDYIGYQSVWYADRSFFKVKNISLGYTLPESVLSKVSMRSCRLYVSAANPLYWAKSDWLTGRDPEGALRNYIFGVQISF